MGDRQPSATIRHWFTYTGTLQSDIIVNIMHVFFLFQTFNTFTICVLSITFLIYHGIITFKQKKTQ